VTSACDFEAEIVKRLINDGLPKDRVIDFGPDLLGKPTMVIIDCT